MGREDLAPSSMVRIDRAKRWAAPATFGTSQRCPTSTRSAAYRPPRPPLPPWPPLHWHCGGLAASTSCGSCRGCLSCGTSFSTGRTPTAAFWPWSMPGPGRLWPTTLHLTKGTPRSAIGNTFFKVPKSYHNEIDQDPGLLQV